MSTLRVPVVAATVLISAMAALATLVADARSSTAETVGVVGVGVVVLATIGAVYGILRGASLLAFAAAMLLVVGHGVLMSPQIDAIGQPAIGVVGVVLSLLLILTALDRVTSQT